MANNTEQADGMQKIRGILLKITGEPKDILAFNGIDSTFETDAIMALIEAEATRRLISELEPIYAEDGGTVWCMSEEGVEVYKKDRLAELKRHHIKEETEEV